MMSKLLGLSCLGIMGLMAACGVRTSMTTGSQPTVTVSPAPQMATLPSQLPAARPLALPVPSLIPPVGSLPAGGSIGGRPDPFSALPLTPTVVIKQNPVPARPAVAVSPATVTPVAPQPSSAATAQQTSSLPSVTVPATVAPGAAMPSLAPSTAPSAVLPAPAVAPTINLAQAIAVSGVVQAGSRTSVIVQVPNETTSRYAVVGDYLANGKVLVKRIEMQGAEPLVVLEQDGAEFVKPVGSGSLGTL
jgi:hypothetical protein